MRRTPRFLLVPLFALSLATTACADEPAKPVKTEAAKPAAKKEASDGQHSGGPRGWGSYRITDVKADPALPRVLLAGDSVANGYHSRVAKLLKGKANVDLFITGDHIGAPDYRKKLAKTLTHGTYAVIHYNESGLHAWVPGRIPEGQYGPLFAEAVGILRAGAPKARLIWASSTPVTVAGKPQIDPEVTKIVIGINAAARPVAEKEGMAIDDLYALMIDKPALGAGDRWHWNGKGQAVQADAVTASILAELAKCEKNDALATPAAKPEAPVEKKP
jgi:lysophospholipase L1-like esterase